LAIGDDGAKAWAYLMHHEKTGDRIKAGVSAAALLPREERLKAFAWLAGFAAHMITDVTIHPVVELKVGKYEENKKQHRVCEMHQDAHIYQRLALGPLGMSEHLDSGIARCNGAAARDKLDPVVTTLWQTMLKHSNPVEFTTNPPDMNLWHRRFVGTVDKIEEGGRLFPLARHVAADCGFAYPDEKDVRSEFIVDLKTPEGLKTYDEIFNKAVSNVRRSWRQLAGGVFLGETQYQSAFGNWNFDEGKDEGDRYVFWRNA
jgi:hypothetical protein